VNKKVPIHMGSFIRYYCRHREVTHDNNNTGNTAIRDIDFAYPLFNTFTTYQFQICKNVIYKRATIISRSFRPNSSFSKQRVLPWYCSMVLLLVGEIAIAEWYWTKLTTLWRIYAAITLSNLIILKLKR